jgi:uncharacterized protein (DUF433 family)
MVEIGCVPGIHGGTVPVIVGTRIPPRAVKSFHEAGYTVEGIREQYPTLTVEQIEAAIAYVEPPKPDRIEALADAWASIDGKVEKFRAGKGASSLMEEPGGHYSGYMCEAEEMIRRLNARGFDVTPLRQGIPENSPDNVVSFHGSDAR